MATNTLSKKKFNTKAPKICKPVVFPCKLPPPPLIKARLWVFADIDWRHPLLGTSFAAAAFCTYNPGTGSYDGYSTKDVTKQRITVVIYVHEEPPEWTGEIWYSWPDSPGWAWEFDWEPCSERPFLSDLVLKHEEIPHWRETSVVMREIPP